MNFEELLNDKSEMTRKTYIQKLKALKNLYFPNDEEYKFIHKPKQLIKLIEDSDKSINTKKSYYIALYVVADKLNIKNKDLYNDKMMKYKNENENEYKESQAKPKVVENYVSYNQLRQLVKNMPEETNSDIQNKLFLSLYTFQPPLRNDFVNVEIFTKKPKVDDNNYFIFRKKSIIFHLNKFKTVKQFGPQKYKYNEKDTPELYKLLRKSYDLGQRQYLFNGSEADLSKLFSKLFYKLCNKHITIQMIRTIYETDLINSSAYKVMTFKQKEEAHKKLLHSFTVANEVYNKVNLTVKFD